MINKILNRLSKKENKDDKAYIAKKVEDDNVVIYTNELGIKSKTIGNIQLKKMDLVSFDHRTKSIITALELLEKGFNNIIDCDCIKTIVVLEKCLLEYHDFLFEDIIKNHKYSNISHIPSDYIFLH